MCEAGPELFDLDRWMRMFPLEAVPKRARNGFLIVGPRDMAYLEQVRAQLSLQQVPPQSVPVDAFVFAIGEPPFRHVTKIGGVPYRPAHEPWPTTPSGKPMTFLAQFCFAESRDIVGDTPGDVLLMFVEDSSSVLSRTKETVWFEWRPVGLIELIQPRNVPTPDWEFVACYGVRHRTVDYARPFPVADLGRVIPRNIVKSRRLERFTEQVSRIWGTKIRGIPAEPDWDEDRRPDAPPGRFLCSIAAIAPLADTSYPWVNQPDSLSSSDSRARTANLDFSDGFIINIYLDDAGETHFRFLLKR